MFSITKSRIPQEVTQEIVAHHLGSDRRIASYEEVGEGFFCTAYRIELDDGLRCVMKVAPPPDVRVMRYEQNIMEADVEAARLVKARTSLPVPAVLCYDPSCRIIPSPFFISEMAPGVLFKALRGQVTPEQRDVFERTCGRYLWEMNQIMGDEYGLFSQPGGRFPTWRAAFDHMVREILADNADMQVVLPMPGEEIYKILTANYDLLDDIAEPRLVYADMWAGNTFVDPDTLEITGFIDLERAVWGDTLMECNFSAFGVEPAFLEGYGSNPLASERQRRRRTLYDVYLYLIMMAEYHFRHYQSPDMQNWAREHLVKDLPTLA
ncbi:MAG: phosphotransferase family protein [Anaerolineae bacterium]